MRMLVKLAELALRLNERARQKLIDALHGHPQVFPEEPIDPAAGLYHDEAFEDSQR